MDRLRRIVSSLRGRLMTWFLLFSLLPLGVIGVLTIVQSRQGIVAAELAKADGLGSSNAEMIASWVQARRDEIRYLSSLDVFVHFDVTAAQQYLHQLSLHNNHYDTIFLIPANGTAIAGVEFMGATGDSQIMSPAATAEFQVADRDWFQRAMRGEHVISEVLLSRATGNRVSTIASPVYRNGNIVGVVRGAVLMDTVLEQVSGLELGEGMEAYLIDQDGRAVTPASSVVNPDEPVETEAAQAFAQKRSGTGLYPNAAGQSVLGAYHYIPMLDWGLVIEVAEATALGTANDLAASLRTNLIVIGTVTLLLVVGIALRLSRGIAEPIVAISRLAGRVAAGDLTVEPIRVNRDDEVGELATSFRRMIEDLKGLILQVRTDTALLLDGGEKLQGVADETTEATDQIASAMQQAAEGVSHQVERVQETRAAMDQLQAAIEQIAQGAQQQAAQVERTSRTLDEMAHVIVEVADSAQEVVVAAEHGSERGRAGGEAVGRVVDGMTQIRSSSDQIAGTIDELGTYSRQIGQIVEIITEIAEQTNLLALNAAIEAARAGEHGRGFGVVAEEVRTLAERSAASTREIGQLIASIQAAVDEAVAARQTGARHVEEGFTLAAAAQEALGDIIDAITRTDELAHRIAKAAQQMSAASPQMVTAMTEMASITQQNTAATEEMAASSGQVMRTMDEVAAISEETAAGTEEVSASSEEVHAATEDMRGSVHRLMEVVSALGEAMGRFTIQ